jgi:hypothetical protein
MSLHESSAILTDDDQKLYYNTIKRRVDSWKSSIPRKENYDNAVLQLCEVVMREYMENKSLKCTFCNGTGCTFCKGKKKVEDMFCLASKEVKSWPKWMQKPEMRSKW